MVLGVDEACTNIIRHAYHLRDDQLISLSLEGMSNCVRMRLRDYGKQTEAHTMKGRAHELIRPGGLGLHFIRESMDTVEFSRKWGRNQLRLVKILRRDGAGKGS